MTSTDSAVVEHARVIAEDIRPTALLTLVETESYRTRMMIFRDLGPYSGQRLERPCDDL